MSLRHLCVDLVLTAIEGLPRSTVAASLQLARSVNVVDVQAVSNISRFEYGNNAKPPNTQEWPKFHSRRASIVHPQFDDHTPSYKRG